MKAALSAFLEARIKKARIGSREGEIMGLCYGVRDLLPCIV